MKQIRNPFVIKRQTGMFVLVMLQHGTWGKELQVIGNRAFLAQTLTNLGAVEKT